MLSYTQSSTLATYHIAKRVFSIIDGVQFSFLREINVIEFVALKEFLFALIASRRDMAILGALHHISCGLGPKQLSSMIGVAGAVAELGRAISLRHWRPRRACQLRSPDALASTDAMSRCAIGLVHCYKRLPHENADSGSVRGFQRMVQAALLKVASMAFPNW